MEKYYKVVKEACKWLKVYGSYGEVCQWIGVDGKKPKKNKSS